FDARALRKGARLGVGTDVEADDRRVGSLGKRDIRFGDAAGARMDDASTNFVRPKLVQRPDDRFDGALHIALDDQRKLLQACGLKLAHHLLERAARTGLAGSRLVAG